MALSRYVGKTSVLFSYDSDGKDLGVPFFSSAYSAAIERFETKLDLASAAMSNFGGPENIALPCHCSSTAALLPEEALFDFRINLVEPLLCALRRLPMPLGFSL
jgi:hypothetical protein